MNTHTRLPELALAVASLDERHAAIGFRWFSERVNDCLALPADEALTSLRALIDEADADKRDGFGPPQHDINLARRKWLDLYASIYGRPDKENAA